MAGTSTSAAAKDGATPVRHPYDPEDPDDDPIVQELDVYICNEQVGSATQLCMLQHPLRPPWRPYQYDKIKTVRMKPEAKRLEVDMPLDTESRNYNDVIEDYKKVKTVTLRSSVVDHKASYAIAAVRDGKLLLAPVDYTLMMRPALTYLDAAAAAGKKKGKDDDDSDEEDDEPKMHAVEVKVQKRETERQAAQRLNSYAHLSAKEEEEKFISLAVHDANSRAAAGVWDRFMRPAKDAGDMKGVPRSAYLKDVVPLGYAQPGIVAVSGPGEGTTASDSLTEAARAAWPDALRMMLEQHGVLNMADVRVWLGTCEHAGAASEASRLIDKTLDKLLVDSGLVRALHRVYVRAHTGDEKLDPLRKLVLELLTAKDSFKKQELNDLARTNNITFTDSQYLKVVKDVCTSKGNSWHIKTGTDKL